MRYVLTMALASWLGGGTASADSAIATDQVVLTLSGFTRAGTSSTITQQGSYNTASTEQYGGNNSATVTQNGSHDSAVITQYGPGSTVTASQSGYGVGIIVTQTGMTGNVTITQKR